MTASAVTGKQTTAPWAAAAAATVHAPHGAALPAGACVCPGVWELWFGLFVYKRGESSLCPPAAVKTLLENQTEVSTQELALDKNPPKQTNLP